MSSLEWTESQDTESRKYISQEICLLPHKKAAGWQHAMFILQVGNMLTYTGILLLVVYEGTFTRVVASFVIGIIEHILPKLYPSW